MSATTLRFELPWGRYHANLWGRSVNEAAVEWPPSPWRILRALYSSWKVHCPDLSDEQVPAVLGKLCGTPSYLLPEFALAHTRHYLPGVAHLAGVKGKIDTDKTFDPFVATERGAAFFVRWPVELDDAERDVLTRLMAGLGYLGRAESIVEARLMGRYDEPAGEWIVADNLSDDDEVLRLLVPATPLDLNALVMSPHQVRGDRRLLPPATWLVDYPKPRPAGTQPTVHREPRPTVNAIRFAISGRPLPPQHAAVAVGHTARRALMSLYGGRYGGAASVTLSGKDAEGERLGGRHEHAHYLAFASKSERGAVLDSLVVWTSSGFTNEELQACARPFRLWPPHSRVGESGSYSDGSPSRRDQMSHVEGVQGRRLAVEAFGDIADVAPELCGRATEWRSFTPYAPTRHWKGSLDDQLRRDVQRELEDREMPVPVEVSREDGRWLRYRTHRPTERLEQARRVFGLRLTFAEPIDGPLSIGQLNHFGLGLFVPVR